MNILAWLFACCPGLLYLAVLLAYRLPLASKREAVRSLLSTGPTIERYQAAYNPAALALSDRTLDEKERGRRLVKRLFGQQYAASKYFLPAAVIVGWTLLLSLAFLNRLGVDVVLPADLKPLFARLSAGSLWGFVGAYVWGLYDLLRRYRAIDLNPSAVNQVWLRMIIATVLGELFGTILTGQAVYWVAFGVGALPLRTLRGFVERRLRRQLQDIPEEQEGEPPNLSLLQGMSPEVIGRLWEEDITRLEHLAFADPVKLFLATDLRWKVILDLIDQALLGLYAGDKLPDLRKVGIRGAIEAAAVADELRDEDEEVRRTANLLQARIATALDRDLVDVGSMLETLRQDSQVRFIWLLYEESFPREEPGIPRLPSSEATDNVADGP